MRSIREKEATLAATTMHQLERAASGLPEQPRGTRFEPQSRGARLAARPLDRNIDLKI